MTVGERHPKLAEQQRLEYHRRVLDPVAERREAMARQKQQQAQTTEGRSQTQEQSYSVER
jgi:SUMO ligase MMS21 Smc5/6 complex component